MIQTTQKTANVTAAVVDDVVAGRLAPGDRVPSVRALADRIGCSPGTAARAYGRLRVAGVIAGVPKARAVVTPDAVARALAMRARVGTLCLSGSDDPALDLLLRSIGPAVERADGGRGSVAGLGLLAQGGADAAAVHLRDLRTGRSNDTFARMALGGRPATLVHLWSREQGIVVLKGNPLGVREPADLAGRALAWRRPGTGSRLLLARALRAAGVHPQPEGEVCDSHLGVAVAVATGAADAGVAVRSAAETVDADFIPLEWEDFELAVEPGSMALLGPLIDVLAASSTQDRLAGLSGYDLRRSGELRVAA
ncbi:MAG: GntR family transcriptional regulator [Propionibacteriales bacterium]|nr:GntR family transcriptional regulator [Propionibacteriales bacterium]